MASFYLHLLAYLVVSFAIGVVWHVVLFKEYYKKLAIYSNIEKPRFSFGFSAMLIQGIVFAYIYQLVANPLLFGFGLFLLLVSFMVFAEAGKQNTTSLSGFVTIQTAFSAVQTILVTLAFVLVSSFF
ncbi:MAG: hypothetical protein EXS55_03825 [Candidatus Magasanikbacteria bacterium]|nr:hypothetical protein [Candidatus Magasanikbacteria bacterium]